MLLTMWGHGVEFAETGNDGLKRANEMQPDIALIDIGLPGLTGYEVARHIRSDSTAWAKKVRLVALTSYGRDADRAAALEAGFDLVKPIDPDVVAEMLQLQ
jgi:CheY-like chemotaxis protein